MKPIKHLIAFVFVVSWVKGVNYAPTPCVGKEPDGVICAKTVFQRDEQPFVHEEAAEAFKAVMEHQGFKDVKMEKRDK